MSSCIFCRIAAGEIGTLIYQDDEIVAFRDANPQAPVHILVIPKKHIEYVAQITDESAKLMGRLVVVANQLAKKDGVTESGYRLVVNNGRDAGQAVPHLHLHLLGGRYLEWPPG